MEELIFEMETEVPKTDRSSLSFFKSSSDLSLGNTFSKEEVFKLVKDAVTPLANKISQLHSQVKKLRKSELQTSKSLQ
jgi:hypothetical protein